MNYAQSENHKRNVRVLAEGAQGKKMTRKVDLWEYESLADCIRSDQLSAKQVHETMIYNPEFAKWYRMKYLVRK